MVWPELRGEIMETRNRNHANRPSVFVRLSVPRMARNARNPRRQVNQLVNFGILAASLAALVLAVSP